jgi:hypothetical protein
VATFDKSGRSFREIQMDTLRANARQSDSFWYSMPASLESGDPHGISGLTFDEMRQEYEGLGLDCVEIYRGTGRQLFNERMVPSYDVDLEENVIVARFRRRSQSDD